MSESIFARLEALPTESVTIRVLNMLDYAAPGEWTNITSTSALLERVTGESSPALHAEVMRIAEDLMADESRYYDQAVMLFEAVDMMDAVAGGATVANKAGSLLGAFGKAAGFGGLGFLEEITPKPETTQAIDAGLKLMAELIAFGMLQGMPKASIEGLARFTIALDHYAKSDLMRLSAWVLLDGLLPLGPHFMIKITETIGGAASSALDNHAIFNQVSDYLPGDDASSKRQFIVEALKQTSAWINRFVTEKNFSQDTVQEHILSVLDVGGMAASSTDLIAGALDASTKYFSHTGVQTVARVVAEQAFAQLREEVWADYLAQMREY